MKPWERFAQTPQEPAGPWTKFKPAQEELPQLSPNTGRKYTDLEKLKYTLRSAGEGTALGAGDIVAGATNVMMNDLAGVTHGQSLADRLKSYGRALWHATPMGLAGLFKTDEFKQGRKDFVREQEEFKEAHPGLNLTGELAGGLVTGIGGAGKVSGAKMLGGLGKWGTAAATGAGSGAAYGFGTGLTRDEDTLDPVQGAKEGAQGAFLGGAFGLAAPAVFRSGGKLINMLGRNNRAYRKVAKAAGDDLQKSIDTQTPLLDIGNNKVAKLGKTAKRNSEKAGDLLDEFVDQGYGEQGDRLHGIVNKYMPLSGEETAQSLAAAKEALSKAAYEPMQNMGPLLEKNPSLANLVKNNPQVRRAILTARKNLPQLPDDGFDLFNEAKKVLDDMAAPNPLASGAEKSRIRYAQQARGALINELDKATAGQYKKALREYGDLLGAERALSRGRELLNMAPQEAAALYRRAGTAEREGLRVGLAQELQRRIRKGNVDGSARNTAAALVGSEQNKKLFRAVLGKDADKFIDELSAVSRAVRNYGTVKGGSDTTENLMLGREGLNFLRRPVEGAINMAGRGLDWLTGLNQEQVARMLIDPGYAALMRAKAGALPPSSYTDISGAGGVFANIFGPLTKRETGIMREEIKKHLKENVRNTSVPNNYVNGGKIKFNKAGLDKAVSSASTAEKLKLLQHLPELSERANPLPISYSDKNIRTFIAPVKKDGVKTEAALTIEQHKNMPAFFHNINPIGYFAKRYEELKKDPFMRSGIQIRSKGATNSIADKTGKIKGKKNNYRSMKDLLILLQRPWTLGLQGNIARENMEDK